METHDNNALHLMFIWFSYFQCTSISYDFHILNYSLSYIRVHAKLFVTLMGLFAAFNPVNSIPDAPATVLLLLLVNLTSYTLPTSILWLWVSFILGPPYSLESLNKGELNKLPSNKVIELA